jgi:hypothetical protein
MPSSLLVPDGDEVQAAAPAAVPEQSAPPPGAAVLADRLAAGVARIDGAFADKWQARMTESFTVAIRELHSDSPVCWQVDLAARALSSVEPPAATDPETGGDGDDDDGAADWSMVGTAQAWLDVVTGHLNVSAALRRNELRYCDFGENDFFVSEDRVALLASLLGLPSSLSNPAVASGPVPALAD